MVEKRGHVRFLDERIATIKSEIQVLEESKFLLSSSSSERISSGE